MELYPLNAQNAQLPEDEPPHLLSADNPTHLIVATVYKNDESHPVKNAKIEWSIQAGAQNQGLPGSFQGSPTIETQTDDLGVSVVTFTGNTMAGDTFLVKAHLKSANNQNSTSSAGDIISGPFKIVAGKTAYIYFYPLVFNPVEGQQFQIVALLWDGTTPGNLVEDGTPVTWYDAGLTCLVADSSRIDSQTTNGRASAYFQVGPISEGDVTGPAFVVLEADNFQKAQEISFVPYTVELDFSSPNPSGGLNVDLAQSGNLTVRFTHLDGSSIPDGVPIYWYTSKGSIVSAWTATSGGVARAVLSSAGSPTGTALVAVTAGNGGGIGAAGSVDFFSTAVASIAADGYLATDDSSYTASLTIKGPPNGHATISVKDVILASYPFSNNPVNVPGGMAYPDVIHGIPAFIVGNPTKSHTPLTYETDPSLQFNGVDEYLYILPQPILSVPNGLVLRVWIRPIGWPDEGKSWVFLAKPGEYKLELVTQGGKHMIHFSVNVSGSWKLLVSDPLIASPPIFAIAAYSTGLIAQLNVNGHIKYTSAVGNIPAGTSPIGIGALVEISPGGIRAASNYFNGYIDDVVISRQIALSSSSAGTILLGPSGQATVPIEPTAPLQTPQPDDTPPENIDWTKRVIQLDVRVYGPTHPDEPVLDTIEEIIQARKLALKNLENSFGDMFQSVRAFVKAGTRAALALDDLSYLASLGNSGEGSFKRTTFAICNVAFSWGSIICPFLNAGRIKVMSSAGKSSLAWASMYRAAVITKSVAEVGQFAELLDAVSNHFADPASQDALQKVAPSKRALQTMQVLAKLDKTT